MKLRPARRLSVRLLALLAGGGLAHAETALFLLSGPIDINARPESYVVAVSDDALIQQARDHLATGPSIPHLVPVVGIASGGAPENLNYAVPGHPAWGWHATSITSWMEYDPTLARPAVVIPEFDSVPSAVPQLIADGHSSMSLIHFPLVMELKPEKSAHVVNLSTRGWVDAGERALIGGFIVEGGTPRNVFIRALGPSLSSFGIQEPLADPKVTLFHGQDTIAINDSWRSSFLGALFPPSGIHPVVPPPLDLAWMVPGDEREAVLWLSLPPGAYTVHVNGADTTAGIALLELYDLDSRAGASE